MPYSSRLIDAFTLAFELHKDQCRKGGDTPYISHLMAVAALVSEYGGNEDQVIAALLHDAGEDQGGYPTLELIRNQFGETVAHYIAACSDTLESPKPPWRERKTLFLESLAKADPAVRLIIACDKLHNARTLIQDLNEHGQSIWERFTSQRDGALWYYAEAVLRLAEGWRHPILRELAHTVDRLQRLASHPAKSA